ncbi:MAG: hypothetical protein NT150_02585 [Bacteroidetes bacterium]|nr:hypothetical protein [Bacteroidota bacterium]
MKKLLVLSLGVSLFGCVSDSNVDPLAELTKTQMKEQVQKAEVVMSDEEFYAHVQAIPTPLQTTALIQALGIEYNESILKNPDGAENVTSWFGQAANLGVFGADMGYANIYGETKKSMDYIGSIRDLADKLKVGQFFDFATIKELAENKDNLEKLINSSQMNFQKMNNYLQKQDRGKVSVAMILGGWVEGLHICCQISSKNPNQQPLYESIGQQKLALETIGTLLNLYGTDKYFVEYKKDFDKLVEAYTNVQIIYHEGEVTQHEDAQGNLVVEDTSTSEIKVTQADVVNISVAVGRMRNNLINLQ